MRFVIDTEPFSSDSPLIVQRTEYRGQARVDIRQYWTTPEGDLAPTKRGVSLPLEQAAQVFEALQQILMG